MDVQTENTDPPPCESQPSGKIRKGFKLFGKRKPGNIFSIRSKADGNNKSPVIRSNTLDGLSETLAPDSEQEADKEKGQELSEGEREQADEEPLGEDGVLAAAHARTSISSASSAKSLSFLSLLRGGRRGVGDRRVQTVSQPTGRQRRGLKGLFSNVKFRSKDKEDKEEAPPSPLLMSSRANSVEIIKEDLTLTPKSQPRSLDSPETESYEPSKSLATPDSAATSPSKTPQVTTVSKTNEHVPPSPTSEPPMVPGDTSLSCLLADISSLLTFDSITGGGDIMADVEAEWGKASSAISSPVFSEVTLSSTSLFSTPTISSPLTSTSVSTAATAKPSPVTVPTTASTQSFASLTKTTSTSSPISKPSTIITTFTKSSTLTTPSVKLSTDSTAATESSTTIKIKSTPAPTVTKPSTTPVTLASLSAPTSSHLTTVKSTTSSTSTATMAPPNTPATVVKAPSASPTFTSTASKLASEIAEPPQMISSVSKPSPVATLPPVSAKPSPVAHTPPIPAAITQPSTVKLDSDSSLNLQTSTSYKPFLSSTAGEFKAPVTVSTPCTVTTKPSPTPVILSKMTTAPTSITTADSVSLSKPAPSSTPVDLNKTPPLPVKAPDVCSSSTLTASKTQPSPASVPTPSSTSLDKFLPAATPSPAPVSIDKMPPTPTPISGPTSNAVASTASPTPPVLDQITLSQPKAPPAPAQIPVSVCKDLPPPAQMHVSQTKASPASAQIPISVSKAPPAPAQVPLSVSKEPLAPAQMEIPQSKAPPAPAQIPVSVSKAPPAPAQIPVAVTTGPPAPVCIPTSVSKEPVSQPKAHPAPTTAPCPVTSPPSTPAPCPSEPLASAKLRGSGLASVDRHLASSNITGAQRVQAVSSKTEELHSEPPREKKMPQVKASGLSKIPVVGGGRATKLPVRDNQHADDEPSRDPPTPVLEEERPHFNSHDAGRKDKISAVEANVPTSKHVQEESQQIQPPKVLTSSARDSKIPVKHGAQSHTASQIPQKEAPRTKIPVSKVPVRRVGNKPAGTGGSTQMRK
ncbi:APC membrane recruitment protein 2 [Amphiprion ocellaris]|uniref:APC membrane recruitment protein 2-like n=1 Tax=Amphiprion ocellaris TaxID=80972 RepID=A0AAQ5ZFP4_AMPOC|nr:APC membrane recruitment protein 2 [Amphiprion ocellaris]